MAFKSCSSIFYHNDNCFTVGVDYEFLSQEVSFSPSLEQQSSLDFNVSIVDDSNVTGSVSQFEVYLNSTQDGVLIQMDNSTAIVNIIDDDRKSQSLFTVNS